MPNKTAAKEIFLYTWLVISTFGIKCKRHAGSLTAILY